MCLKIYAFLFVLLLFKPHSPHDSCPPGVAIWTGSSVTHKLELQAHVMASNSKTPKHQQTECPFASVQEKHCMDNIFKMF